MSIGKFLESLESASEEERSKVAQFLKGTTSAEVEEDTASESKEGEQEPAETSDDKPDAEETAGESEGGDDAEEETEVESSMLIAMEGVVQAAEDGHPIPSEMRRHADRELASLMGVDLSEGASRESQGQDEEA